MLYWVAKRALDEMWRVMGYISHELFPIIYSSSAKSWYDNNSSSIM